MHIDVGIGRVCVRETSPNTVSNTHIVFHLSDWVKAEELRSMRWNLLLLFYVSQRIDGAVQQSWQDNFQYQCSLTPTQQNAGCVRNKSARA